MVDRDGAPRPGDGSWPSPDRAPSATRGGAAAGDPAEAVPRPWRWSWTATAAGPTPRPARIEGHTPGEAALMDVAPRLHRRRRPVGCRPTRSPPRTGSSARRGALPDGLQPRRDPPPGRRDARDGRAGALGRAAGPGCGVASSASWRSPRRTRHNDVLTLTMCVNYGGRAEIADAVGRIADSPRPAGSTRQDRREDDRPLPRRAGHARRRPVRAQLRRAAPARTSCSGSPPTPRWSSWTPCSPTSTAATSGRPSRSTPAGTGASAGL